MPIMALVEVSSWPRPMKHLSFVATLTRRGEQTSVTEPDRRWGAVRL